LAYKLGQLKETTTTLEVNQQVQKRFAPISHWHAPQFSLWKRVFAMPYLRANGQTIHWGKSKPAKDATSVVWGSATIKHAASAQIYRMEDGFIHSLGLGSDLSPPCSQVIDSTGIYFDAQRDNDLFKLLNNTVFDEALLERAANLQAMIVDAGITKYNLGRKAVRWQRPVNRRVILVVGQVADDASVRLGAAGAIASIEQLLAHIWQANTDAMIVYKPHPDVLSGNRIGLVQAKHFCHLVDAEADIISLIEQVDEVHTLSSLAGFDALLRGKKVVTYGLPFYAGWGLTEDNIANIPHRTRSVTLEMLVAATLILYPIYWDWQLMQYTTPEATVSHLAVNAGRPLKRMNPVKRILLKTLRWCRNVVKFAYSQYL
jgi:capsular polysaccharide export protein